MKITFNYWFYQNLNWVIPLSHFNWLKNFRELIFNFIAIFIVNCSVERCKSFFKLKWMPTGGATVTTHRTKLDPTNVNYLFTARINCPSSSWSGLAWRMMRRGKWKKNSKMKKTKIKLKMLYHIFHKSIFKYLTDNQCLIINLLIENKQICSVFD